MTYELVKELARKNRAHPTPAEDVLWQIVRAKRLGVKFNRQHIINNYIADFICLEKKLIIEVDGKYHFFGEQPMEDAIRENCLTLWGYTVLRFTNNEVLCNTDQVREKIIKSL